MWEGQFPDHVRRFFDELQVHLACAKRKAERLIYSRNAKKGRRA